MVGAGIGGSAAAYYLRQEFGPGVKIDVFEAGTVGGRLATAKIGDYEYETGGSVIHPLNLHMKHFIDKLGEFKHLKWLGLKMSCDFHTLHFLFSFQVSLQEQTSPLKWRSSTERSLCSKRAIGS